MATIRAAKPTHQYAVVAQLVRVSACHAEGRGFESRQPRHYKRSLRWKQHLMN